VDATNSTWVCWAAEQQVLHEFHSIHSAAQHTQVLFVAPSNFWLTANLLCLWPIVPDDSTPDFCKQMQPEGIGHHRLPEQEQFALLPSSPTLPANQSTAFKNSNQDTKAAEIGSSHAWRHLQLRMGRNPASTQHVWQVFLGITCWAREEASWRRMSSSVAHESPASGVVGFSQQMIAIAHQ